jgi:hypothetical protein
VNRDPPTVPRDPRSAIRDPPTVHRAPCTGGQIASAAGNDPSTGWPLLPVIAPDALAVKNRQGAPAYRVKNRRNPPKIQKSRTAATGLPSGSKGHVSLK